MLFKQCCGKSLALHVKGRLIITVHSVPLCGCLVELSSLAAEYCKGAGSWGACAALIEKLWPDSPEIRARDLSACPTCSKQLEDAESRLAWPTLLHPSLPSNLESKHFFFLSEQQHCRLTSAVALVALATSFGTEVWKRFKAPPLSGTNNPPPLLLLGSDVNARQQREHDASRESARALALIRAEILSRYCIGGEKKERKGRGALFGVTRRTSSPKPFLNFLVGATAAGSGQSGRARSRWRFRFARRQTWFLFSLLAGRCVPGTAVYWLEAEVSCLCVFFFLLSFPPSSVSGCKAWSWLTVSRKRRSAGRCAWGSTTSSARSAKETSLWSNWRDTESPKLRWVHKNSSTRNTWNSCSTQTPVRTRANFMHNRLTT